MFWCGFVLCGDVVVLCGGVVLLRVMMWLCNKVVVFWCGCVVLCGGVAVFCVVD